MVGAVSNPGHDLSDRAGVDSKLPNYFFYLHATAPVWSVPLILKSTIICESLPVKEVARPFKDIRGYTC